VAHSASFPTEVKEDVVTRFAHLNLSEGHRLALAMRPTFSTSTIRL
jgi:hypothetical protein